MAKLYPETSDPFKPFEMPEPVPDYHAIYSVQVCELVNDGFDVFGDEGWADIAFPSAEVEERLKSKLLRKFWFREIDPRVPGIWRYNLTTKLQLIMPKYAKVYEVLQDGLNPMAVSDRYEKNRRVFSDFPATQLDPNTSDYASSADDYQAEQVELGDVMDKMRQLGTYNDVDAAILEELEPCFCQMLSMTIGGM